MRLAVEFDVNFYNEQVIYTLLTTIDPNYQFVLCQKRRCENTKAFENMCKQFQISYEYQEYPESCTDGMVLLKNGNYEITLD